MVAAVADLALRRPWALLAGNLAVLTVAVIVAAGAPAHLGVGSLSLADHPGAGRAGGSPDLVIATTGTVPVSAGEYRIALNVISSHVRSDPDVASVRRGPVAAKGRSTSLLVSLGSGDEADRQQAVERIEEGVDPGPLRVSYGGEPATVLDARRDLAGDLWGLELLAVPFALLVLFGALGPRLAAAPVICAATAIAAALAGLRIVGAIADLSLLGIAPAAIAGLALGVETPSLLVERFRDEASRAPPADAMRRALGAGARLALPLGLAVVAATAGLLATPLDQAPSIVLGCALAAGFALLSAAVCVPALLALGEVGETVRPSRGETLPKRALGALTGFVARSRVRTMLAALIAVAALLAAAAPLLDAESRPFSAADLPSGSGARTAAAIAAPAKPLGKGAAGHAPLPARGGDSLFPKLPLAAGISAAALAVVLGAAFRSLRVVPIAIVSLLPAAAACGLAVLVFQEGHLASAIGQRTQNSLETGAVASLLAGLGAVCAARSVTALGAARDERQLGLAPRWAGAGAAVRTVPAATIATLITGAAAALLVGTDLYPAREFGLAVAAGLLLDLLLLRIPLISSLARWGPGSRARQ